MHTYSGKRFNPLDASADDIDVLDIAHHLSNVCRYGGACKEFYSVAQHSVICSWLGSDADTNRWLLMHDASEAYIGDVISPLKMSYHYDIFREIEDRLMAVICERFELPITQPEEVHEIDILVRHTEMRDFGSVHESCWLNEPKLNWKIRPLSPEKSKFLFLDRYQDLFG